MPPRKDKPVNGKRLPSIQDVAIAADVSTATVSRVLNNPNLVSPETAEKVRKAVVQLGYKPNLFAQGLMTRKSRVLGIALPDIHGEFYSELLRGADAEARRRGYHILVGTEARKAEAQPLTPHNLPPGALAPGSPELPERSNLAFGLVDGLAIMITEPNELLWREARELALPVVVLDVEIAEPGVDCIMVDNGPGTKEATEHLLAALPGDKLYFVGGPRENFDTQRRGETFVETLRDAGIRARKDQLAFGRYSVEWGYLWAGTLLKANALRGIGVLAGNDEIALGVLQAAQDARIKVPEELRIVGYDDTRLASLVRPSLSSVRVPMAEVGAAAISTLIDRIAEPERPATIVRLPTKLVVRESSDKNAASGGF
ncbi:MAG: LacI family DNA-binding transcriptional regulator [Phycisphaerales bacterium]|nr:LacI family DNA-binding transcriptional regulator [Phycisphaerales bacterium]